MSRSTFIATSSAWSKPAGQKARRAAIRTCSWPHPRTKRTLTSKAPVLELTYNWDSEDYTGGRNFGHLAFEVDDIYQLCADLQASGVTINRPPRDYMAFIRSPDGISIELLQKGGAKDAAEPWQSMENTGSW